MLFKYPNTAIKPVTDEVHGKIIVDDYRWLENVDCSETKEWITEQNQFTDGYLNPLPARQKLSQLLRECVDDERISIPEVRKDKLFYLKRCKGQNQSTINYVFQGDAEKEYLVVDPNEESNTGVVALDWWYPSPDGSLIAYGLSKNGDEWSTLYIVNTLTGERLKEAIPRTRYASVAWKDDSSFFYTRYPEPGEVEDGRENYNPKVYFHRIGTDYREDQPLFGEGLALIAMPNVTISNDRRYLIVHVHQGWRKNDIYIADLEKELEFIPVIKDFDALFHGVIHQDTLYLMTNYQASNYRLLSLNLTDIFKQNSSAESLWKEIIPESEQIIQDIRLLEDKFIVHILRDAKSALISYNLEGQYHKEINLPYLGTISGMTEVGSNGNLYILFESFVRPASLYRLDSVNFELSPWMSKKSNVGGEFEVEQHFYISKDGTKVPMFILHKKGLQRTGATPTVLNGYGGFNSSVMPAYNPAIYPWLMQGGIYAIANLRGGGEYGEDWHRGGSRENKQNVFDDFIYAAKFLIKEGYTDSAHLGIYGRSNGGLLVGAALTQAPELFRAVVCQVPLLDMLRYHKFLIGGLWTDEYGNPDVAEECDWIYPYSPYHHVEEGTPYPAVLFMTAISDTRVHPLHALKMTALMQKATTSVEYPVLLRVEYGAGHGIGKPVAKFVEEQADIWSFMAWQLGLS